MSIDELLGIPFKFGGRDKNGVDCLGLVWLYFRSKRITFPDTDGLPMKDENQPDYLERVLKALDRIAVKASKPLADDIVVMRLPGGYTHLGVMVDDKT